MSKVYNYMILSVGLVLLMKFAGIPTGADSLLIYMGYADNASQISTGTFFLAVAALFAIGVVSGITISFFTKTSSESYLIAPIALGIFTVISSTFVSIINYTNNMGFVNYLVWLIFAPLLIGFGIAIIQFWRGTE
jgi:hypothetical protein